MKILDCAVKLWNDNKTEILLGFGIGGVLSGVGLACYETTKINPIIEEHKEKLEAIYSTEITEETADESSKYTVNDRRKDITLTYVKTGLDLAKLYLPSGLVITGSIVCILASHRIMSERNAGLTAAYTGISETFAAYRQNIIDKYGQEADIEARYSIKAKKKKGKDGEEDTVIYEKPDDYELRGSDHSRFFKEKVSEDDIFGSRYWNPSKTLRLSTLHSTNVNLNRKLLNRKSHTISLNEVYDALDLAPSKDGNVLGYVYRPGIDPLDENGLPMVVDLTIICFSQRTNKPTKTTVSEALNDDALSLDRDETLIDFPNLVPIV